MTQVYRQLVIQLIIYHGLGDCQCVAYTAFIASTVSVFDSGSKIVSDDSLGISDSSQSLWCREIWSAMSFFNYSKGGDRLLVEEFFALRGPGLQHHLSNSWSIKIGTDFHASYATNGHKARRLSIRCQGSGGFLQATPSPSVTEMDNDEWLTANRLRLGLPLTQLVMHLQGKPYCGTGRLPLFRLQTWWRKT